MAEYPKTVYHDDGRHAIVTTPESHKQLGPGWTDKYDPEKHAQGLRKAAGAVGETILPVTRTRPESV